MTGKPKSSEMFPEMVLALSSALASEGKVIRSLPFTDDSFSSDEGNWSTLASSSPLIVSSSTTPCRLRA